MIEAEYNHAPFASSGGQASKSDPLACVGVLTLFAGLYYWIGKITLQSCACLHVQLVNLSWSQSIPMRLVSVIGLLRHCQRW